MTANHGAEFGRRLHNTSVTIQRNIVVPVVCSVVLVSIIVACFSLLVLPSQFSRWEHHLSIDSWSHGARALRHFYRFGPVILVVFLATGLSLFRHSECSASRLAWYAGSAIVVLAIWTFWTFGVLQSFYELSQPA